MKNKNIPWQKYEQSFLVLMVGVALFSLYSLFDFVLMPIVFAIIITCASYPIYRKINASLEREAVTSGIMVLLLSILVILPVVYLLTVISTTIFDLYQSNQTFFTELNFEKLNGIKTTLLD